MHLKTGPRLMHGSQNNTAQYSVNSSLLDCEPFRIQDSTRLKDRSPDQTVISISLPRELLARIDERAASLNIPRSRYLALLARTDVDRGGALKIAPSPAAESEPPPVDPAQEVEQFLAFAVPALADYERQKADPNAPVLPPPSPEVLAENKFWSDFLDERDEILRLKWIDSQKAGRDIGIPEAIRRWLDHRARWQAAHSAVTPMAG
jgi:hypothetical protein